MPAEDEQNLSKVSCDLGLFEEYVKRFLGECEGMLTREEIGHLTFGAKIMTLECGIRFLSDYLQEDIYFKIHRPDHNLNQRPASVQAGADMEEKWVRCSQIVARYALSGTKKRIIL